MGDGCSYRAIYSIGRAYFWGKSVDVAYLDIKSHDQSPRDATPLWALTSFTQLGNWFPLQTMLGMLSMTLQGSIPQLYISSSF